MAPPTKSSVALAIAGLQAVTARHKALKSGARGKAIPGAPLIINPSYRATTTYFQDSQEWIDSGGWADGVSSNVDSIAYDIQTKTLYVAFQNGGVYMYPVVPIRIARDMFNASSLGKFVHQRLVGHFGHRRIK